MTLPEPPKGNASRDEWVTYVTGHAAATVEDLDGLARDEIRDRFGPALTPERVLAPEQTAAFERLLNRLPTADEVLAGYRPPSTPSVVDPYATPNEQ